MRAQKTKAVTLLPSNVFSSQCLLCGRLHSLAWKDIIAPLLLTQLFQQLSVSTISCYTLLMPFDVSGTSVNQRGRQKRALEIDALYIKHQQLHLWPLDWNGNRTPWLSYFIAFGTFLLLLASLL